MRSTRYIKIGSSPLTRGTLRRAPAKRPRNRFIPAYAGNSCVEAPGGAPVEVHPRLRGELVCVIAIVLDIIGSSPLTRGTLVLRLGALPAIRFIPAYAGNSA